MRSCFLAIVTRGWEMSEEDRARALSAAISSCGFAGSRGQSLRTRRPHEFDHPTFSTGPLRQPALPCGSALGGLELPTLRIGSRRPTSAPCAGPVAPLHQPRVPGIHPGFRHPLRALRMRGSCIHGLPLWSHPTGSRAQGGTGRRGDDPPGGLDAEDRENPLGAPSAAATHGKLLPIAG